MKLSAFELGLKEAIKHAPSPDIAAQLQAIYDRLHGGGAHTLDDGGHSDNNPDGGGPTTPPPNGGPHG